MRRFAGLDWGGAEHAACVVDEQGQVLLRMVVDHTAEGLRELCRALRKLGPTAELPIAIERPSGLIVDVLVAAGHPVVPIHPNALKACRSRYRAVAAKSDPGDAYILADVLRTDGHRWRPLSSASDQLRALRTLVRSRSDLVAERVALANQLRALLDSFWPGAVALFADVDSPIALAFLHRYPTPHSARRLGEARLAAFLAKHSYTGRRSPRQLLDRLRAAPDGQAGDLEQQAKGQLVRAFVAVLRPLVDQLRDLSSAIEQAVAEIPRGQALMSFPRAGKINAAQILAELGDDPRRFPSAEQLAAEAGAVPVTYASGKSRGVAFRFACNKRLRQAITCFADNSRHQSPWAAAVYARARARGCAHPHAVRILARAWIRVLWRCWTDAQPYCPAHHGAVRRLHFHHPLSNIA